MTGYTEQRFSAGESRGLVCRYYEWLIVCIWGFRIPRRCIALSQVNRTVIILSASFNLFSYGNQILGYKIFFQDLDTLLLLFLFLVSFLFVFEKV